MPFVLMLGAKFQEDRFRIDRVINEKIALQIIAS